MNGKYIIYENFPSKTSLPGEGSDGILKARRRDIRAIPAPAKKTREGEYSQTSPKTTGIKTATIWLIVKETPALEAMSAGSAIF